MCLMTLTFYFCFPKECSVYRIWNYKCVIILACLICVPCLLLFHLAPFFCSFKEQASQKAVEGGSKQRTNRHSQIFNEFLQLGLKLVELSEETQITEPWKEPGYESRKNGNDRPECQCCLCFWGFPTVQCKAAVFAIDLMHFAGPKNKYRDWIICIWCCNVLGVQWSRSQTLRFVVADKSEMTELI